MARTAGFGLDNGLIPLLDGMPDSKGYWMSNLMIMGLFGCPSMTSYTSISPYTYAWYSRINNGRLGISKGSGRERKLLGCHPNRMLTWKWKTTHNMESQSINNLLCFWNCNKTNCWNPPKAKTTYSIWFKGIKASGLWSQMFRSCVGRHLLPRMQHLCQERYNFLQAHIHTLSLWWQLVSTRATLAASLWDYSAMIRGQSLSMIRSLTHDGIISLIAIFFVSLDERVDKNNIDLWFMWQGFWSSRSWVQWWQSLLLSRSRYRHSPL